VSPAKTAEPIGIPFGLRTRVDIENHVLDGVQVHPSAEAFLGIWGQEEPIVHVSIGIFCCELCARSAEPIDLPFGLWTRVGRRKHKFSRIRQAAPMCPHGKAHWRHLADTIEPFVCGSNAVLCQITLTTFCILFQHCTFIVTTDL